MKAQYAQATVIRTEVLGGGYLVHISQPTRDPELRAENANFTDTESYAFRTLAHARNYIGTLAREHDPSIQRIRLSPKPFGFTYTWKLKN